MTEFKYAALPELQEPSKTADPHTRNALVALAAFLNGSIGSFNIENGSLTEEDLSTAVKTLLNQKSAGLTFVLSGISLTAKAGEFIDMTTTGTTVTLPAVVASAQVGVFCGGTATSCKVSAAGGAKIYGDFVNAATTITLTEHQHVTLQSDGTNWFIIAGEPKRETAWEAQVTRANETLYTPSASRETEVLVELFGGSGGSQAEIYVGGTKIAFLTAASPTNHQSVGFRVGAGVAWQAKQFEAIGSPAATLKSSYRNC